MKKPFNISHVINLKKYHAYLVESQYDDNKEPHECLLQSRYQLYLQSLIRVTRDLDISMNRPVRTEGLKRVQIARVTDLIEEAL